MNGDFFSVVERRAPAVAKLLQPPTRGFLPLLEERTHRHLRADVGQRVSAIFKVVDHFEWKARPYAFSSYPEFGITAQHKRRLVEELTHGSYSRMTLEIARTAKPIKTLFVFYDVNGRPCKFLVCTAESEFLDKPAKKAVARKLQEVTGTNETGPYSVTKVIAGFGRRHNDETIARELGVISGVSNPILSRAKLEGMDAVLFTPAAVDQGLSEIALSRIYGLILDSRDLFEALARVSPGRYHLSPL